MKAAAAPLRPLTAALRPAFPTNKCLRCTYIRTRARAGDHTRAITVMTPSNAAGGIMRFAKVKATCLSCKAPLAGGGTGSLCGHCKPKEAEIYNRCLSGVNELEAAYGALWTQCQRCQGSLHMDVLCTSRDCPIFYRRKKVQKELNEAQGTLARFADW